MFKYIQGLRRPQPGATFSHKLLVQLRNAHLRRDIGLPCLDRSDLNSSRHLGLIVGVM